MEYIVKIIDSLAWPIAIIWLGYVFRSKIRQLISRMSHLKYKDIEAKFEKELKEAEMEANVLKSKINKKWENAYARGLFTQYEQLERIAEVSPRAAILEAWIDVEAAVSAASENAGIGIRLPINYSRLVKKLVSMGKIPEEVLPLYSRLLKLRNEAAHTQDFALDQYEAIGYLDLSRKLANTFRIYGLENT